MKVAQSDINKLSIFHLNTLRKVVQTGSAGEAAEELGISQPSVSYHLNKMRAIFNDELFVRTAEGLKPTDYCSRLVRHIHEILTHIEDELLHADGFEPMQINRSLTVHCDITTMGWFPRLFSKLNQQAPQVSLTCHSWNHHSLEDLVRGQIDFGVHMLPSDLKGVYDVELGACRRVFVVHQNHPLAKLGVVTLKDLSQYQVLMTDLSGWNSHGQSTMERVMSERGYRLNVKGRFGDCGALFDTLRVSNCITYTSTLALPDDLSGLVVLPAPSELMQRRSAYRLKVSNQRYGSQEYSWFIEVLTASFQEFLNEKNGRPELEHVMELEHQVELMLSGQHFLAAKL
ncbi:LysR family transcriptional regulator [Ferrimonas lipolytica]|uniref:LysR family transcriptional regulator n=1 Tax=Ferrimonas lipolytica TaxID=2724191 RepID=A0A6H1UHD5_9GAMM|nr:LysR family transcriptional regulator [Ferrimonas lipolytica]QIZ78039.1 LysR family transcriptional regulator [Ferrimonas lipolytica]